jgi:hypothetical protein
MSRKTRRRLAGTLLTLVAISPIALVAQPAAAFPKGDSVFSFNYQVVATATIKKANLTMSPPPGVFKGGIDLDTGKLKGTISLPNTTFTQSEAGVGLVTATAAMVQTKPVTGTINLANFKVTATSTFNIRILTMYPATPTLPVKLPLSLPISVPQVNLVGKSCTTSTPVTVTMSGIAHIGAASKFSGTFAIPSFKTCGVMTPVLNQEIPGPGNTFSASATPAKS